MTTAKKTLPLLILSLTLLILAGCSDDDIVSPTTAAAPDTAPPAIPTGLAAAPGSTIVKLAWNENFVDADLAGFLVYRLAFGNAYQLTPQPIDMNVYIDARPLGMPCGYAVSAVDAAGNESAWLEIRYDPGVQTPEMENVR